MFHFMFVKQRQKSVKDVGVLDHLQKSFQRNISLVKNIM